MQINCSRDVDLFYIKFYAKCLLIRFKKLLSLHKFVLLLSKPEFLNRCVQVLFRNRLCNVLFTCLNILLLSCDEHHTFFLHKFHLDAHLVSIGNEHVDMLQNIFNLFSSILLNLKLDNF